MTNELDLERQQQTQLLLDEEETENSVQGFNQVTQQTQKGLRVLDNGEVEFNEAIIAERDGEILEIERGVMELNGIFRDLGSIVTEHGAMIDNIESNITQMNSSVRGASRELTSAARYQKNARKRACILIIIFAVILAIILAAVSV